jgi:hypothetical protein
LTAFGQEAVPGGDLPDRVLLAVSDQWSRSRLVIQPFRSNVPWVISVWPEKVLLRSADSSYPIAPLGPRLPYIEHTLTIGIYLAEGKLADT